MAEDKVWYDEVLCRLTKLVDSGMAPRHALNLLADDLLSEAIKYGKQEIENEIDKYPHIVALLRLLGCNIKVSSTVKLPTLEQIFEQPAKSGCCGQVVAKKVAASTKKEK